MRQAKKSSIRRKLIRIILTTTAVVLVSTSAFIVFVDFILLRQTTARGVGILAEAVAFNSVAALAFEDRDDASEVLRAFHAEPNIRQAVLYDADGEVFARFGVEETEEEPFPAIPAERPVFEGGTLLYLAPVWEGDDRLGSLVIRYDLGALRERLQFYLLLIATTVGVALLMAYLLSAFLQRSISGPIRSLERVARRVSERHDYGLRAEILSDDEVGTLTQAFNEMLEEIGKKEAEVRDLNRNLELRVAERTAELRQALHEIEAFSYSVSHDLRAPLRAINGFSLALLDDHRDTLDDEGRDFLDRIVSSCQRMGKLIDGLLELSRVTRHEMQKEEVNLSELARESVDSLRTIDPDRQVEVDIREGLLVEGDSNLLGIVLDNLIRNAWKFTSRTENARIEVGCEKRGERHVFFVRDNGAGFDMDFSKNLFGVFQRLHPVGEFEGTGIGLATVRRIIERHGGEVWAEGKVDSGATFYFTLPSLVHPEL